MFFGMQNLDYSQRSSPTNNSSYKRSVNASNLKNNGSKINWMQLPSAIKMRNSKEAPFKAVISNLSK
jgi:hypothetical protein